MAWRKYFTTVPSQAQMTKRLEQINKENGKAGTTHKFSSYLPEVYAGAPNRIERYVQYDQADLDSEINRALDTIAEFCTQNADDDDPVPFRLIFREDLTETEIEILKNSLQQWSSINRFNQRIFRLFRNTLKYGDQFFIRDPETFELLWVDASKVEKIVVNEAEGKAIEQYVIRDLDFNLQSLTATNPLIHDNYSFPGGYPRSSNPAAGAGNINYGQPTTPGGRTSRFYNPANSMAVDAAHVVHLSLSEGMDQYWPFGISILEAVYKTYKQKDLLEDCMLIYRIVRAPERRVFYIDVGQLQGQRAMAYVERVKNEVYQRRMPNRCLDLNTRIYLLDGRLIPLRDVIQEHNQGKTNWVYSCCPVTGKIVPGKITWAGETRSAAQVVRLTLDNGQQITCTPDHKFPILGKGFVEAQNLAIGESFIPAYFREDSVGNSKKKLKNKYTQVFDPSTKQWKFTHRLVADFFNDFEGDLKVVQEQLHLPRYKHLPKETVHHRDFNRYNNNPENLVWMNSKDHICYHADMGQAWKQALKNNPHARAKARAAAKIKWRKFWADPKSRAKALNARIIKYTAVLFDIMVDIIHKQPCVPSLAQTVQLLNKDQTFIDCFKQDNTQLKNTKRVNKVTRSNVLGILKSQNIISYREFVGTYCLNLARRDLSIYKYSDLLMEIFVDCYKNLKQVSLLDMVEWLKQHPQFSHEFSRLHAGSSRSVRVCYAYVRCLLAHYGYPSFYHFKYAHPQTGRYDHARPGLRSYSYTPQMLQALRGEYNTLKKNIHYTQKTVGFKRLYPALKNNRDFVKAFREANPTAAKMKIGPHFVMKLLKDMGFDSYEDFVSKEPYLNHKLVSIEWLDEPVDTGTITVDGDEIWHNYHTFAIEGGIFTKNSGGSASILDTAYNPISITEDFFLATNSEQRGTRIDSLAGGENLGCFSLDTKIKLLDGRDLSILDIETEMREGKQLWTYSCHPVTGEIAPGKITWAGKTRSRAQVLRITLDSGDTITCTPDHKFPIRGVGFVEAKDLPVGQNLITLHAKEDKFIVHKALLDQTMDVGTLTVDGDHELHDWHTYALSVGVFVKNSIDDLKYFNNKLMRGLGIPSSYLPTGPDDGTAVYNDGKVGTAFIQEYRFNKYCQRLQNSLSPVLDMEFKLFLKNRGVEIAANCFELAFNPPQSFSEYRNMALDTERVNLFSSVMNSDAVKYMSKRYALERYLGWTQADILENERMWKEENAKKVKTKTGMSPMDDQQIGLGGIGIKPEMEPTLGEPELPTLPGMEMEPEAAAPESAAEPTAAPAAGAGATAPPTT